MSVKQKHQVQPSLGIAFGILTACLVTIIGAISRHEPETILFRMLVGGILVGFLSSSLSSFMRVILTQQDDEDY